MKILNQMQIVQDVFQALEIMDDRAANWTWKRDGFKDYWTFQEEDSFPFRHPS